MSFPRYPKYKDSGVEWLGQVPEHWQVKRLKTVASHNDEVLDETTSPDTEIVYVDISSVNGLNGINAKETMIFSAAPSRARRRVKHGDVIVSTVRTYLRAIAHIRDPEDNLIVSTGFAVIRARSELKPDFVGHLLSTSHFVEQVIARSTGVSYPAINASELVCIPVSVPPLPEQTRIAEFLDQETAKIDALVAEQQRLMALLKEKRQAVISHAVTKGLNPQAPLKPSGIEWLGDVPADWKIKRIKHLIAVLTDYTANGSFASLAENVTYLASGFSRLVRLTDLREDLDNEGLYVDEHAHEFLSKSELFGGEILIANVGAYAGYACLMPRGKGTATLGPNMYLIRCKPEVVSNEFGLLCLMSPSVQEQLKLAATSTAQPKLNKDDVKECVTVIPPTLTEQRMILDYLSVETSKFDALTAEAQRAIDLLQERRTALISAAVTGQIDVSRSAGFQPA